MRPCRVSFLSLEERGNQILDLSYCRLLILHVFETLQGFLSLCGGGQGPRTWSTTTLFIWLCRISFPSLEEKNLRLDNNCLQSHRFTMTYTVFFPEGDQEIELLYDCLLFTCRVFLFFYEGARGSKIWAFLLLSHGPTRTWSSTMFSFQRGKGI
jgi:hypothetical protein